MLFRPKQQSTESPKEDTFLGEKLLYDVINDSNLTLEEIPNLDYQKVALLMHLARGIGYKHKMGVDQSSFKIQLLSAESDINQYEVTGNLVSEEEPKTITLELQLNETLDGRIKYTVTDPHNNQKNIEEEIQDIAYLIEQTEKIDKFP
jgi:hypothetical protein